MGTGPLVINDRTYDIGKPIDLAHADEQPMWFGALSDGGKVIVSAVSEQQNARYVNVFDTKRVRTLRIRIDSVGGYPRMVSWCAQGSRHPGSKPFRTLTVNNTEKNSKYDDDQFLMTLGWDASFQIASDAGTYTHFHDGPKTDQDAQDVAFGLLTGAVAGADDEEIVGAPRSSAIFEP
jgi:hypothetical protein